MGNISCICSGKDCDSIRRLHSGNLFKCSDCNLIFLYPQPSKNRIQKIYEGDSLGNFDYYLATTKDDEKTFNERLELTEKFIKMGSVLDIGCSTGTFLKVAKHRKWKCFGVELNKKSADFCRKQDFKVFNRIPSSGSFDLINMSDVIEHYENPKRELLRAKRTLKKDGLLLISTPDYDKFLTKIFQIKPEEHFFYFTKETLRNMLQECGFSLLYLSNTSRFQSINTLVHSSTFQGSKKILLKFLLLTGLYKIVENLVIRNSKADILAIARKK